MTVENQSAEVAAEDEKAPAKANVKVAKKAAKKVAKKAAKKTSNKAPKAKGKVGRSYPPEKIKEVLEFLKANPGRGSVSKAVKKFGITFITISKWNKQGGGKASEKAPKGTSKRGRPPGRPKGPKKASGSGDTLDTLMAAIKTKKAELSDLLKQFEVEARSL